jgi:hypothetical protein
MRNSKNGWTIHEAGMALFDDIVGDVMKKLKDMSVDANTIGSLENFGWFQYEFWRFVFAQQVVAKRAMTALEFPTMQRVRASTSKPLKQRSRKQ